MSGLLSLRDVRHGYGPREVLRGVDLDVAEGEIVGLLGPNGSGKSTLLAVVAGLVPRQAGTIAWDGRLLPHADRAFRTSLAVVFQREAIDPKLTVLQNLLLAGRLQGLPAATRERRARELAEEAGLAPRLPDVAGALSGGLKRRLDLARALVHEPRLLVMDEPTSGLDEASFRETWERVESVRRRRRLTVLVATHRPDEASRCDRLAVIAGGRVERVATPAELEALVARDVVVVEGPDPLRIRAEVASRFGLPTLADESGRVLVECERGHELIPRLVEALAGVRLDAVGLRRPTLADAFLKITGRELSADESAA